MMEATDVITCGHCGNQSKMDLQAECRSNIGDIDDDDHLLAIITRHWLLLQCPACNKPVLIENSWNDVDLDVYAEPIVSSRVLYPPSTGRLQGLPPAVAKEYQATLKVRHISPASCAVLAGRTLEVLCKVEGAAGRLLVQKFDSLVQAGKIPSTLGEMAQQLRQIRNLGAHSLNDEVTADDVNVIIEFLEAILEYLYVAPARIAAVQARLKKNR